MKMTEHAQEIEVPKYWLNPFSLYGVPPRYDKDRTRLTTQKQTSMFRKIFLDNISKILMSKETEIKIPKKVRKELASWRPTPLERAEGLEERLELPDYIRIYCKKEYEDSNKKPSPTGTHKSNA